MYSPRHEPVCCWSRVAVLLLIVAAGACSRVTVDQLPPVPAVQTDKFLPGVANQLDAAFAQVRAHPTNVHANAELAKMLQTYRQFVSAQTMYQRVRLLDPDNFEWRYLHAVVLQALGQSEQAIVALRETLLLAPDYQHARLRLAELLADEGAVVEADRLFKEIMAQPQAPPEAHFSHGKFLLRQGQVDAAIVALKYTLEVSGNLGVAHYQLGLAYRKKNQLDLARESFALAKRHEGYSADSSDPLLNQLLPYNLSETPFVRRAKVLAEHGRMDEARRFIAMALERNPDSVPAHASMIGMAARERRFDLVDEHFARAVAIEPANAKLYFNLGIARIAEQRWVEAARALETSLELDDSDPNAHVQLAILRHKEQRKMAAERGLRAALALAPGHATANWLLGELLHERGNDADAIGYLQKAVATEHPLRAQMFALLAQAQAQHGDFAAAEDALRRATQDAVTNPAAITQQRLDAVAARVADLRDQSSAPN